MSHFSKISSEIRDAEALQAAADKMGFPLVPGGRCRYFLGRKKADFVLKLPGKYDVAIDQNDGIYSMEADFYGGHVEKYLGPDAGFLMRQYSAEKTRIEAFKHSLAVTEENVGDTIVLTLTDADTGGRILVTCYVGGKIDVRTTGFPGHSCMKFQDLENALGAREGFSPTMEMYEEEPLEGTEHIYTT